MGHPADVPARRARVLVSVGWPIVLLALVAVAISVVVHEVVYPAYSFNRDEAVYLWQVQALAEGKVFTSGGGMPLFYQPWLSGIRDGMFFSQYTLGWPLVLVAFDLVLGSAAGALAFGTALAVVGTYAFTLELTRERGVALLAAALLVVSPLLAIQSGVYLGYLFSLGLGALFGAALLAGIRLRRWWLLVMAGLLVGWLFMTRPFDGILWGGALLAYVACVSWRDRRALVRTVAWVALGFLPLLVATLAYNRHVTGSFTEFPIVAADSRDTFGFGTRGMAARWTPTPFTAVMSAKGIGRNAWELPPFLFGSYLALPVIAVGLWLRRRDRTTLALLLIAAAFPVGYFFFWGISLSASFAGVSGPIYYVPLFLPGCVLVAFVLTTCWRRSPVLSLALVAVMTAATVPFLVDRITLNHRVSEAQVPWRDATDGLDDALVIVARSGPYLLHLDPFSSNAPDLDGDVLYAADRGPENLELIAAHPDRTPYVEAVDRTPYSAATDLDFAQTLRAFSHRDVHVSVTPIVVERGPVVVVRADITSDRAQRVMVASLRVGDVVDTLVLGTDAARGETFVAEWRLSTGAGSGAPGTIPVPAAAGNFRVDAAGGADAPSAMTGPHDRLRFSYRVHDGELEVLDPGTSIRFRAVGDAVRPRRTTTLDTLSVDVSPSA
jgi:hypothetical protein